MHPILWKFCGMTLRSYGLLVAVGYAIGIAYLCTQIPGRWLTRRTWWSLVAVLLFGAFLGGKLAYFLVEWRDLLADPWGMLRGWKTGWVFWGGFLGAILFGWFYQLVYNHRYPGDRKPYLPIADYLAVALPMGHWLGRVGCFLAGCCHGRPTDLPWAVTFTSLAADMNEKWLGVPLHPVQLYEAAGVLAIFLLNLLLVLPRVRAGRWRAGTAFLAYLCEYAVLRFFTEFFRGDDRGGFLCSALSPGQWMSLGVLLVCGTWLWRRGVRLTPEQAAAQDPAVCA